MSSAPPLCCAVCWADCRPISCHVRVPHTVVYSNVLRAEIQSMSGLACVRLCLPCYPCVQLLTWCPAVFDRGHTNFPKTRPTEVPEDIRQVCRGCFLTLGAVQAHKVCRGPAPYPRDSTSYAVFSHLPLMLVCRSQPPRRDRPLDSMNGPLWGMPVFFYPK